MYKIQTKQEYQGILISQKLDLKFEQTSNYLEADIYELGVQMYKDAYKYVLIKNICNCAIPITMITAGLGLFVGLELTYASIALNVTITLINCGEFYNHLLSKKFRYNYPDASSLLCKLLSQLKKDINKTENQLNNKKLDILAINDDIQTNVMRQNSCQDTPEEQFTKIEEIKYHSSECISAPLSIEKLEQYRQMILNYNNSGLSYTLNNDVQEQIKVKKLENGKLGYRPNQNL